MASGQVSSAGAEEAPGRHRFPLTSLPREILWNIMRSLQPSHTSLTDCEALETEPRRNPATLQACRGLARALRTCRLLADIVRPLLYEQIVLENSRELLNFFRTLVQKPSIQAEVLSFAIVGRLTRDVTVEKRIFKRPAGLARLNDLLVRLGRPMIDLDRLPFDVHFSADTLPFELDGVPVDLDTLTRALRGPRRSPLLARCNIGTETQAWIENFFSTTAWPSTDDDKDTAQACEVARDELFTFPNILVMVLALIPRVKHLHLFLSEPVTGVTSYPVEFMAMKNLLGPVVFPPRRPSAPKSYRFLQELSTIVLEPANNLQVLMFDVFRTLAMILSACKALKRVVLKGPIGLPEDIVEFLDSDPNLGEMRLLPPHLGHNVVELVIVRTTNIHIKMARLVQLFPNLRRLAVECDDCTFGWIDEVDGDDGDPIHMFRTELAKLSHTLESLTIAGGPGRTCSWCDIRQYPSLLDPNIEKMEALKHLTTDCAWLFGIKHISSAPGIISRLPKSLVSLHLVDYWGVSLDGPTGPELTTSEIPEAELKSLTYYPPFEGETSCETPLQFFEMGFKVLSTRCQTELPLLRDLTLSSPCFNKVAGGFVQSPGMFSPESQKFVTELSSAFQSLSISFSCMPLEEGFCIFQSKWDKFS